LTQKKLIILFSGILGTIGVLVSVVIIAVGGGFYANGPSIFNPPSANDLWSAGAGISNNSKLNYSLTILGDPSESTILMKFTKGNDLFVKFEVKTKLGIQIFNASLTKEHLALKGFDNKKDLNLLKLIENSILSIRDITREPKYLVVGAIWDSIYVGSSKIDVRVTSKENVKIPSGIFETFVLSYDIGGKTSKIYINKDMPLPIKAEVYDASGNLQYKYVLLDNEDISI
jgi:hypothetical protein